MAQYLDTFISINNQFKSSFTGQNTTVLDLVNQLASESTFLETIANRTSLSTEIINLTITSVLHCRGCIAEVYNNLNSSNSEKHKSNLTTNSSDCQPILNYGSVIPISFFPAVIIIFILSMVNTRVRKRKCCGGRPGLAIPVNLLDGFENRFCYAFAFGATASRLIGLTIFEDYSQNIGNDWTEKYKTSGPKAVIRAMVAFIIGITYYPFFACIFTQQRLLGAVLGTVYSLIWLYAYIGPLVECRPWEKEEYSELEAISLEAPTLLCHFLLLLCFVLVFVTSLVSKKRGIIIVTGTLIFVIFLNGRIQLKGLEKELTKDEWKENYKYKYVKKLLQPIPKSEKTTISINGFKRRIVSKLYKWRPDFKYSTRIICTFVTALVCLYTLTVLWVVLGRIFYRWLDNYFGNSIENDFSEVIKISFICWIIACVLTCIKDIVMMANMVAWYRGHLLRLQRGDRSFLPVTIDNQEPISITGEKEIDDMIVKITDETNLNEPQNREAFWVASFKFCGYQVAYIMWGFIITQFLLWVIISAVALLLFWPLIEGNFADSTIVRLLKRVWPTLLVTVITIIVQRLMAKFVFLRDAGATLALNNRRLFNIASYFLFFLNIFVGIISCLKRIIFAVVLGTLFLPRLQKSSLPRDWELSDPGYMTYVGYLCLEHTHTNPVLMTFSQLLVDAVVLDGDEETGTRLRGLNRLIARRAKNRWFLAITLINNPELSNSRRQEKFIHKGAFAVLRNVAVEAFIMSERLVESHEPKPESSVGEESRQNLVTKL